MTNTQTAQPAGRHAHSYSATREILAKLASSHTRRPGQHRGEQLRAQLVDQQPSCDELVARLRLAGHL